MVRKKRREGAEEVVEPVKAEEREKSSPTRPRRRERSANGRFVPSTNKDVEPREKALSLDELSAVGELGSELDDEDGVDMLANWMHWTAVAPSRAARTVSEAAAGCLRCGSPTRSLDDDFARGAWPRPWRVEPKHGRRRLGNFARRRGTLDQRFAWISR